jgi:hypothetical protein
LAKYLLPISASSGSPKINGLEMLAKPIEDGDIKRERSWPKVYF